MTRKPSVLGVVAVAVVAIFASPALADFTGQVVEVVDGDTIRVLDDGDEVTVRLEVIDAPESDQPFGDAATRYVTGAVVGERVRVVEHGEDYFGRTIGEVLTAEGENLNRVLVREGFAWWFERYNDDDSLGDLQAAARAREAGLWAGDDPIAPWDWRDGERP
jgi:endonuclease YncB( thermonuclease family)